ncbi:MAG: hypothetical protein PHN88_15365 [Ignavibacteria bacterium]|nr:hypothetical protein [Ignavibacteria bacterium]
MLICCIRVSFADGLDSNLIKSNPLCDEAPFQINIDRIGNVDINCFAGGKTLYVPLGELFTRLKIDFNFLKDISGVKGFFVNENVIYYINPYENYAQIDGRKINVARNDFYITESEMYMNSDLYNKIFEIKIDVEFKQLKAYLSSKVKPPAVLEIERNLLRENSEFRRSDLKNADCFLPRKRKLLSPGVADWTLNYSHTSPVNDIYSYNLSYGSEILGGDFTAFISGNNKTAFDKDNADWRWRFVDDKNWFRQGIIGNIYPASGLLYNTRGFQITNAPPIARRTIGNYKIFDRTGSKWDVELYINNEFIAYTRAANDGYFEFNVPLLYGSNYITLKYYGTSGEIRTEERVIQVPFNFLPKGTVEYNVSGGTLRAGNHNAFSESTVSWGITKFLTAGSGLVYIDEKNINKFYPFSNASVRIVDNLIFSANYYYDLKGVASLSLLLPSQIYSSVSYIKYGRNGFFNQFNYNEEENVTAYVPFSFKGFSASFRVNARNVTSDDYKFIFLNSGMFVNYRRFQVSFTTNAAWVKTTGAYDNSNSRSTAGLSYRIFSDLLLRQQTDIDHSTGRIANAGLYIDKGIFKTGWLTAFVFRDIAGNNYSGGLTFRFDFSFGRYSAGYSASNTGRDLQQSLFGSVGYDPYRKTFVTDNQNMVSRGALSLVPFIDMNGNGIPDNNEHILNTGFNTKMNSGKLVRANGEYRYLDLDPYNSYRLEVEPVSFDNPLLRPKYKTFGVTVDPNGFKIVPVPVYMSGIINGNAKLKTESGVKGISMLKMILESSDGKFKLEKYTFSDGEFIFDNVPPGKYRIYPDTQELQKRSLVSETETQLIEIRQIEDGDIIDGLDFYLGKIKD